MEKQKAKIGQLWKVDKPVIVHVKHEKIHDRETYFELKVNEIIEIRYEYAWHFRTKDGVYAQVSEEELIENCTLYGNIWNNVLRRNKATLAEILKLELYEPEVPF